MTLSAEYALEYPYHRSTGEVIGRFLGALKERRIVGTRASDGHVLVPALEYDPRSGEQLGEFVEVGQSGVVMAWTWIDAPRPTHLLQRPFAFALVRLDGASTAMLHLVDAGAESAMRTGMRVRARWRSEPQGMITDIECFEPEDSA